MKSRTLQARSLKGILLFRGKWTYLSCPWAKSSPIYLSTCCGKVTLVEHNFISNFSKIIKEYNNKVTENLQCYVSVIQSPVRRTIKKYKNYFSLQKIQETYGGKNIFTFNLICPDTILSTILPLDFNTKQWCTN